MRVRTGSTRERAGFTLVEMVVVIGIIAVLASLLLGAIGKARVFGQRTTASTEMSQIEAAAAKFKIDYGFNPPQKFVFPRHGMQASWTVGEQKSAQLLTKMFRGYDPTLTTTPALTFRGTTPPPATALGEAAPTLLGFQSLVFFLGGPNLTGFEMQQPYAASPDANSKKGPFYTFDAKRFIDPETKADTLDFRDPWGTAYAYFSSGTTGGDKYDPTYAWTIPDRNDGAVLGPFRLGGTNTSPWANPGGIQIISAGPDQAFGTPYTGTPPTTRAEWTPGQREYSDTVSTVGGLKGNGADDMANFNSGTPLGTAGK